MTLLDGKFDFNADDTISDDPDLYDYPKDEVEAKDRWLKRVKLDLLSLKVADKIDGAEAVAKLKIRYKDRNRAVHQFNMGDLLEVYLTALTKTFDPHSNYMSSNTWKI